MNYFVVYDTTGKIKQFGGCPQEQVQHQVYGSFSVLDVTDNPVWNHLNYESLYVDAGALQERPSLTYTCPTTATVGTSFTLTAPTGTAVIIDSFAAGVIDATGSTLLTLSDAGTYDFALSLWPYLDVSFQVVAS